MELGSGEFRLLLYGVKYNLHVHIAVAKIE
jgi:hypothetical protein